MAEPLACGRRGCSTPIAVTRGGDPVAARLNHILVAHPSRPARRTAPFWRNPRLWVRRG
jgi:hypothetical protein